jgi:hypothetical protein
MKQTAFFEATLGRSNVFLTSILNFFFMITSYPRLLLEVFLRRRFGTGYFSLAPAIILSLFLFISPVLQTKNWYHFEWLEFFKQFFTWYLFAFAFAYKSWRHYQELRLPPGVFDFSKFSKYSGDKDFRFYELTRFGINVTSRLIATFLEPLIFFVLGLFLILINQPIGYLILLCSVIYSLGYCGAFRIGDMYLQEIIDKMILSQELSETCMEGKSPRADRGFENFSMPKNPDQLKKMASFAANNYEFSEVR